MSETAPDETVVTLKNAGRLSLNFRERASEHHAAQEMRDAITWLTRARDASMMAAERHMQGVDMSDPSRCTPYSIRKRRAAEEQTLMAARDSARIARWYRNLGEVHSAKGEMQKAIDLMPDRFAKEKRMLREELLKWERVSPAG
uniref:Uncharacterized protein n=1 Tax=Magnetococcus massalia (strain MO-1) TaxID=451514 RepID=A0A1S7LQ76_MAGMO|nr:Protein of unknown function [Candidatus Magnetococcus massalia]